jgi:Phage virion morphogenesis family
MSLRFELSIHGDRLVARELIGVEHRALDARPAFREIARDLIGWEKDLFRSSGASGGRPWAALEESTVARKAEQGLDPRVLQARRDLRKSLTVRGNPNMIMDIERDGLTFGSRLATAEFAQHGTRAHDIPNAFGSGRTVRHPGTPPRPIGQFSELQKRAMIRTLQTFILRSQVAAARARAG